MRELVDKVHHYMWEFHQQQDPRPPGDPVKLRRYIGRQVSSALMVVAPATLTRMGHTKVAMLIDVCGRYDITLGELMNAMLTEGIQSAASVARDLQYRKRGVQRIARKPNLTLVP